MNISVAECNLENYLMKYVTNALLKLIEWFYLFMCVLVYFLITVIKITKPKHPKEQKVYFNLFKMPSINEEVKIAET